MGIEVEDTVLYCAYVAPKSARHHELPMETRLRPHSGVDNMRHEARWLSSEEGRVAVVVVPKTERSFEPGV